MTRDEFQEIAWRDFIDFAIREPQMRKQFTDDTGISFPEPPKNALEAMIDKATGNDIDARMDAATKAFVRWATEAHWGLDVAPASYRAEIEAERARAET